jgi:hypothetical protein
MTLSMELLMLFPCRRVHHSLYLVVNHSFAMPDKPHTESGLPKVKITLMIDPALKHRAIAANVNFSQALEDGVKLRLNPANNTP